MSSICSSLTLVPAFSFPTNYNKELTDLAIVDGNEPSTAQNTFLLHFKQFKKNNREFLAEFIGTLILVLLTCGVAAEEVLLAGTHRSWLTTSIGSGLAVLVAVCVAGHVSGAHLNPAITMTFCAFSSFPLRKAPAYITAQFLGAFSGAAVLYALIEPALSQFDGGRRQAFGTLGTANIFSTAAAPDMTTITSSVMSELIGTALLVLIVMVTGHPNNLPFKTAQGMMVAMGVMTLVMALGPTSGFSLNPARDLGPRVFTAVAGWGSDVFVGYAIVVLVAPMIGGLLGGLVYTLFID
ncbi:MAG: aquaporin-like protein [Benjaminiella poitrasii]|nr:MAG: aquaporin-like protein [Benjaminiella poitrasii]